MSATTDRALSIENLVAFEADPETARLRGLVRAAQSWAAKTRLYVDAYADPIVASFGLSIDHETRGSDGSKFVTRYADLWRTEADCTAVYAALDVAHDAHAYQVEPGVCPALVAESQARRAEGDFLAHVARCFEVFDRPAALAGRLRGELLDLTLCGSTGLHARLGARGASATI